jgi:carbon storage regulator
MLILSRKLNESIVIDGRIIVKVLRIDKDTVKLGIQAPSELPVHREEIHEVIQKNKLAAEKNAAVPGNSATPPAEVKAGQSGDKRPK